MDQKKKKINTLHNQTSVHKFPLWNLLTKVLKKPATWIVILFLAPLFLHVTFVPVHFNQYFIEGKEIRRGGKPLPYLFSTIRSAWTSGLNSLKVGSRVDKPTLDDPASVFHYVFSWLPNTAEVYPTEAFYYYSYPSNKYEVWGNLGTAGLEEGKLSLAYFTVPETQTHIHSFGSEEGVEITRLSEHVYDVTYRGRTVTFRQNEHAYLPPKSLKLSTNEEFVGRVRDESGVSFFLMYNNKAWTFYYVLDDEDGLTEALNPVGDWLEVGEESGFVYVHDREWNRRILVGVHMDNIKANNFFDGPCDQVPFDADLRNQLHHAYPNSLLYDGVDEHGVWLNRDSWERLAICAFRQYTNLAELNADIASCASYAPGPAWWDCSSREWWNTPFWRRMMLERILLEGKNPPLKPDEMQMLDKYAFQSDSTT